MRKKLPEKQRKQYREKNYVRWIIAIVVTFGIITIFLGYSATTGFLMQKVADTGNFTVGDELRMTPENNKSFAESQTVSGNFLPSSKIVQTVAFNFLESFNESYIRTKAIMKDDLNENQMLKFDAEKDWIRLDDGYYYYTKKITPNLILKFSDKIIMPDSCENFKSNRTYTVTYILENIPANRDFVEEFWKIDSSIFVD